MADRLEIKCINKSERNNEHERILNVGGFSTVRWKHSQSYAIQSIEAGVFEYFVKAGDKEVAVAVATSRYGHKYLRTTADGEGQNNLLSLPDCPAEAASA
jgi:hypothetical protein